MGIGRLRRAVVLWEARVVCAPDAKRPSLQEVQDMIDGDREWLDGSAGSRQPSVRGEILESWRRSRLSGVDASHVGPVAGHPDTDWRISRVGVPILESMAEMLVGANTSLLLSAPDGTLLWRWDENSTLRTKLNKSDAVVGTRWSEDVIGTNGLGTALETARPITITGAEHYSESLHPFVCAGAPIRHPVTRRVTGVLSVTSLVEHASPLMAPTLLRLARDVEQELYSESSLHEREMLQHFLAERRRLRSAVVAVSAEVFIANLAATGLQLDHADLWRQIEEAPTSQVGRVLPGGSRVTALQPVLHNGEIVGAVVVADEAAQTERSRAAWSEGPPATYRSWEDVAREVGVALARDGRVLVSGEAGVGKRTLVRTASGAESGTIELDCALVRAQGTESWLADARRVLGHHGDHTLVLAHLEALDDTSAHALAAMLDVLERSGARIAATSTITATGRAVPQVLLDRFPLDEVVVPPLRKRSQDVLTRLENREPGTPRLTRQATELALRHPWPGNDRQLAEFRRWLSRQQRAIVDVGDLPVGWRSAATRHNLSAIQVAEAEAITGALREADGNKSAAADALGISRSSMYRKMREYHLN
jgi:transcriptional regulator of acetoin/glycerol metabolism